MISLGSNRKPIEYRYHRLEVDEWENPSAANVNLHALWLDWLDAPVDLHLDIQPFPGDRAGNLLLGPLLPVGDEWSSINVPAWTYTFGWGEGGPISSYRIGARTAGDTTGPSSWRLLGSDDGTTWDLLDEQTGVTWGGTPSLLVLDVYEETKVDLYLGELGNGPVPGTGGETWTIHSDGLWYSIWESITYGNGLFVAVTPTDGGGLCTSPDGITWTIRAVPSNSWRSVTYGNGLFVVVGTSEVMTSPDGITWTARAAVTGSIWQSITYGNGLFVAVARSGTNRVMTSPDGITWTARSAAEANTWQSVTYGNGLFVAVSDSGTNRVMTSPDGITWTARSAAEANSWYSVTYGNGLFVAVANNGTNRVMTSPDGINWTARSAAEATSWFSVTYGNGLFVAVGSSWDNIPVMTSPDGITWTARTMTEYSSWRSVTYGNGLFVAVSEGAFSMDSPVQMSTLRAYLGDTQVYGPT